MLLGQLLFHSFPFLQDNVGTSLGKAPDEVIISGQVEAEVESQVFPEAYVEGRSKMTRPKLEIGYLVQTEAFPGRGVCGRQVRMANQEVHHEQLEEAVENEGDPPERVVAFGLVGSHVVLLDQPQGEEQSHD